MSGYRWICKVCGHKSVDAPAVLDHHEKTGHTGSELRMNRPTLPRDRTP